MNPSLRSLLIAFTFSLVATLLMIVPIINIPFTLLAAPVYMLLPAFSKTGKHVEWWFLGVVIKSIEAYLVHFIYFWLIAYLPTLLFRKKSKTANTEPK